MISIIVPVYNKQDQIKRCIESVMCQSYEDWELILVDDGSTDNSASIIVPFLSDARIHYFYKENGGVSSARNIGLEIAVGEWIVFLDSDDYFLPDGLAILLNTALSRNVKVSTANFYVEKDNKRYGQCEGRSRIVKNNFRAWYFMTCYPRTGAALFHSSIITDSSFDVSLHRYEDVKFLFPIMRKQIIAYSSDYVMVYSEDNLGLSKRARDPSKDYTFYLDFVNKSFFEKMALIIILKQGLVLYPEYANLLRIKYKKEWYLMYLDNFFTMVSYVRVRIVRFLRKIKRNFL